MSIRIMTAVWQNSPYKDATTMLTLLALADWCDDKGVCWPSVATLANKSRQSVRNARYVLRKLQRDGIVEVFERRGRNHVNRYRLNLQALQVSPKETLQVPSNNLQTEGSKSAIAIADKPLENHQEETNRHTIESLALHYKKLFGYADEQWTLTPLRLKKGLERLKECINKTGELDSAVRLMRIAMDGLRRSEFHNGANPSGAVYNSWEKHLFGTCEQMEKWISQGTPARRPDMIEVLRKQRGERPPIIRGDDMDNDDEF